MKVKVNQDTCIGCGACVSSCRNVFSFNDGGYAQAVLKDVGEDDREKVEEAIEACPTDAIIEIKEND